MIGAAEPAQHDPQFLGRCEKPFQFPGPLFQFDPTAVSTLKNRIEVSAHYRAVGRRDTRASKSVGTAMRSSKGASDWRLNCSTNAGTCTSGSQTSAPANPTRPCPREKEAIAAKRCLKNSENAGSSAGEPYVSA